MESDNMMQRPKLSVIVPIYNVERYISKCIESILNQTFTDYEIILVDDGSTDHSSEICDEYVRRDERIRVIHKINGGISSARNAGLRMSRGTYVTIVDPDDFVDERMFEEMIPADGEDADCIVSGLRYVYNRPEENREHPMPEFELSVPDDLNTIFAQVFNNYGFSTANARFYSRKLIMEHELFFNESFSVMEDSIFTFDFLRHCAKWKLRSGVYYNYFQNNETSLMKQFNENADQALLEFFHKSDWIKAYLNEENQNILKKYVCTQYVSFILQIYNHTKLPARTKFKYLKRYSAIVSEIGACDSEKVLPKRYAWLVRCVKNDKLRLVHTVLLLKEIIRGNG